MKKPMDGPEDRKNPNFKDEPKTSPMDKNGVGDHLPSRNDKKGENPQITTIAGTPVDNN